MKYFFPTIFIIGIFLAPALSFADPAATTGQTGGTATAQSSTGSQGGFFSPGQSVGSGSSFQNVNFSGVGSALAGCANLGGSIVSGIAGVFGGSRSGSGSSSSTSTTPPTEAGEYDSGDPAGEDNNTGPSGTPSSTTGSSGPSTTTGAGGAGQAQGGAQGTDGSAASSKDSKSGTTGQSVPTSDSTTQTNTNDTKTEEQKQTKKESCLDAAAYALAKNLLQGMSNKTLNWVTTGLNGNPFYVRDIDSYLKTVGDDQIGSYLNGVSSDNPIFGNALKSILTQQITGKTDGLLTKAMNTPEAKAYQDFQSDFTKGGWSAFLNTNNNAVGAYFDAADTLSENVSNAKENIKNELQNGNGFLDMKKCVEYDSTQPDAQGKDKCIRFETVTPGSVIAEQVKQITTSPIRQLEMADEINEVVGAFFDQMLNRLFADGLSALTGRGAGGGGVGPGSNVVFGSDGGTLGVASNSADNQLGYDYTNGGYVGEIDISRPQQLASIIITQRDFVSRAIDSKIAMNRIIPHLGELDYCIPGPNPTWTSGLDDNAGAVAGSIVASDEQGNFGPTQPPGMSNLDIMGKFFSAGGTASGVTDIVNLVACASKFTENLFGTSDDCEDKGPKFIGSYGALLYDKVTEDQLAAGVSIFTIGRPFNWYLFPFSHYMRNSYINLIAQYKQTYDPATIRRLYTSRLPAADKGVGDQKLADALDQTNKLLDYNASVRDYNPQYDQAISDVQGALNELDSIYADADFIINGAGSKTSTNPIDPSDPNLKAKNPNYEGAKNRYIREMKTKGTPVNVDTVTDPATGKAKLDAAGKPVLCIDNAYQGGLSTKANIKRNESDIPDPKIQHSIGSRAYFYSRL